MTNQETLKLALEALKEGDWYIGQLETIVYSSDDNETHENRAKVQEAIKALEEALAKQEQPLPPVEIGVDVTADGASVVAFYRRPNAVMEMFYSQFHPQPKQEQGEQEDYLSKAYRLANELRCHLAIAPAPQQRMWVDLSDEERNTITRHHAYVDNIIKATETKLKKKNT